MKALVVDAEWAPRPGAEISEADAARHWAMNASQAWRHPRVVVQTVDDPAGPAPNEVLLGVGACGICGSDVHMYETDDEGYMLLPYHLKLPIITGHEFAGTVMAVGSGVKELRPGDLVAVEEIQWCGRCTACRGGYWNQCQFIEDLGFTLPGGFADYVRVDAKHCWPLNHLLDRYGTPERVLEVGAFTEPTSVAYEGIVTRAGGFKPGSSVVVAGAGPIGLAAIAIAGAAGAAQIICFETVEERRRLAADMGATHVYDPLAVPPVEAVPEVTRGLGAHMVVECTGNLPAVGPWVGSVLAPGGKLTVIGMDARSAPLDAVRYQLKAGSIYGTVGHTGSWDFPMVINLMAAGRIQMEKAITVRKALDDMAGAVEATRDRRQGKILVKPAL